MEKLNLRDPDNWCTIAEFALEKDVASIHLHQEDNNKGEVLRVEIATYKDTRKDIKVGYLKGSRKWYTRHRSRIEAFQNASDFFERSR